MEHFAGDFFIYGAIDGIGHTEVATALRLALLSTVNIWVSTLARRFCDKGAPNVLDALVHGKSFGAIGVFDKRGINAPPQLNPPSGVDDRVG